MIYSKTALTIDEQIAQLEARGLVIVNKALASHCLQTMSYYRLAGYWWPMQKDAVNHSFKDGSTFEDVIFLYDFDRELRILLFDVIERVEIGLRTKMIYHLSHEIDPWWFQNPNLFIDSKQLIKSLAIIQEEIERSKDVFIKEQNRKYKEDKRFPPSWKTMELTSLGNLSKLYGNLKSTVKSKDIIAAELKAVNHKYLPSWLQSIAQIRNVCAHHGRLWNKNLPGRPKILSRPPGPWITDVPKEHEFHKIYIHLCIMKYLLDTINPTHEFSSRLKTLLEKYPSVDENALGFRPDWRKDPFWN
ncbi:MAG: Abi family protein [Candidatus Heimdallarchaeota archaeon]|nr:Abi family protein [Candidatus Heimdallarchaeota archaeon]